ncbi:hypothetical protein C8F04DRAFT_1191074 [Mycena alexandri]|uniref:Uncharacterized protein n=1 Tax=Mycena alexandri TaxID=1745969 RepID=A0AAD6WUG4_9AGAR|nr:hypothetical protein C8F04DRAFT_1191074 [Mycena alexandri]
MESAEMTSDHVCVQVTLRFWQHFQTSEHKLFRAPFEDAVEKPIHAGNGYHARALISVCESDHFAVHCIVIATGLPPAGWQARGSRVVAGRNLSEKQSGLPEEPEGPSMSLCMWAFAGLHGLRVTRQPPPRLQAFGSCESLGDAINPTRTSSAY